MQIIQPHKRHSRPVGNSDFRRVRDAMVEMAILCQKPFGKKSGAKAIAHCQVEEKDPLRFFVLANGDAVVNPKIISKSGRVYSTEGCMSYPFRDDKKVHRFDQIVVSYTLIMSNGKQKEITDMKFKSSEGPLCFIFQHELDHFVGKTIYD